MVMKNGNFNDITPPDAPDPIAPPSGGATGSGSGTSGSGSGSGSGSASSGSSSSAFSLSSPSTGELYITCAAVGVPQQGQPVPLNVTDTVEIMPLDTNLGKVWFASTRSGAIYGPRSFVPDTGRTWSGTNLSGLWIVAETPGEGVSLTIKSR